VTVATKPRLGFLGVGWIGRDRLEAVERAGVADIAAIADPALDGALGSLEDLLDAGVDGVVIATPSAQHAEQALAALERGRPVFCQKPLGRTAAEARAVVEAAREADLLLGVDLSYRHVEGMRLIRELVEAGELGDVFAAELVFHNAYGPDKPWFYDAQLSGGGCVIDLGIHLIDLALWMLALDGFERVEAHLVGAPVEHYAHAQLDHVRIACSWNLHAGHDAVIEAHFHGSDGGASLRNVGGSFYDFRAERYRGRETETLAEPPDEWGGRAIVEWARRVAAGEGFDPEAERHVLVAETIDRIYGRTAA
jgi:predicted dehydrogenase